MIKGSELLTGCIPNIFTLAQLLEAKYGTIIITSGFRSPERNKEVGGSPTSQHCLGKAIDVCVPNVNPVKVAAFVMDQLHTVKGFGLDVFAGYVHLDVRDSKTNVVWIYDIQGKAL